MAMYINHSCDPNCETEELRGRVWVMSLRPIAPGEELTYDYNLYDGDEDEARCYCGAGNCRKTMYSPEEIARRKRAAQRKALKQGSRQSVLRRGANSPRYRATIKVQGPCNPSEFLPMAYQVLARKYRPQRFSDVAGQEHVTRTLATLSNRSGSPTATSSAGIAASARRPSPESWPWR